MTPQHEDKSLPLALEALATLPVADLRRTALEWTDEVLVQLLSLVEHGSQGPELIRQNVVTRPNAGVFT